MQKQSVADFFIKKRLQFSFEICEIFKKIFSTEYLCWLFLLMGGTII